MRRDSIHPILVWKGAPQWLAPLSGVQKPKIGEIQSVEGQIVLELELGVYVKGWTTTDGSRRRQSADED